MIEHTEIPGTEEGPADRDEVAERVRALIYGSDADESDMATQAEEPIEDRLMRAYLNGYAEGLFRGARGRFDHS